MPNLPSRNRRFDLYEDPCALRARRAQRFVEAIRTEIKTPGIRATVRVRSVCTAAGRRARLEYEITPLRCTRTAYLTPEELERLRSLVPESNGRLKLREE
jgi:hypothetical protein